MTDPLLVHPDFLTRIQEVTIWKQAFAEQKIRADSNFRAWIAMTAFALLTNISWVVYTWWR